MTRTVIRRKTNQTFWVGDAKLTACKGSCVLVVEADEPTWRNELRELILESTPQAVLAHERKAVVQFGLEVIAPEGKAAIGAYFQSPFCVMFKRQREQWFSRRFKDAGSK